MMNFRHTLAVLTAGTVLLAGCGDQQITENIPSNTEPQSQFRVLNFIGDPRAATVDIQVEGVPYRGGVGYRNVAASNIPYRAILTGQRTVRILQSSDRGVALFDGPVNIAQAGQIYTLLFAGTGATIQPIILNDGADLPGANQFRVRVAHASPSIGAIDVYVITTAANLTTAQPDAAAVTLGGVYSVNRALNTTTRVVLTPAGSKTPLYDATLTPPAIGGGSTTLVMTNGATAGTVQITPISP